MITINGRRKAIILPSSWEDLSVEQFVCTITKLLELLGHQIHVFDFKFSLFLYYTGYKPGSDRKFRRSVMIKYYVRLCLATIRYFLLFLFSSLKFRDMLSLIGKWKKIYFPKLSLVEDRREIINANLTMLAERIQFPIRSGKDGLEVNNRFNRNPIPWVRLGLKKYRGKKFDVGIIIRTDISAREFTDAFDLVKAFAETRSQECLNTLCSIMYPRYMNHERNLGSTHYKSFMHASYPVRYGIMIWFTGIVQYFIEHPIYRVLFSGEETNSGDKIYLGMGETIMHLSLVGFGSKTEMENIPVVDYFDLQVKSLKKMIADAKAQGAKTEDIVKATRLSYTTIEKLS